ncbi:zinc finger protein castor homolog 1 isoform X1 [Tachysurus ichikawai]
MPCFVERIPPERQGEVRRKQEGRFLPDDVAENVQQQSITSDEAPCVKTKALIALFDKAPPLHNAFHLSLPVRAAATISFVQTLSHGVIGVDAISRSVGKGVAHVQAGTQAGASPQRTHAATAPGSLTSVSRHLAKGWHRASALGYGEGETNTWHEKREREGERVENRRCGIEEVKRRRGRMTDIKKVEKLLR